LNIPSFDNASFMTDFNEVIHFHQEGKADRAIVLLHGMNAHSGTWRYNTSIFAKEWKVIAPSLPPIRSEPSSDEIGKYAKQVTSLLDSLQVHSAIFIGNSMGGWIALHILENWPEKVEKLVLEDSAGIYPEFEESEKLVKGVISSGVPTLVIWGKDDTIIPVRIGYYIHQRIPESKMVVIENGKHSPHWYRPDEFNSAASNFLHGALEP